MTGPTRSVNSVGKFKINQKLIYKHRRDEHK